MNPRLARRLSQGFFLLLFAWLCGVSSEGESFWQTGSWPVTWFLGLDPLLALSSALGRGALQPGLAWAFVTVALTLLLGRAFCGWVCPLGTLQHALGWLARRGWSAAARRTAGRPVGAERLALWVLLLQIGTAAGGALAALGAWPGRATLLSLGLLLPAVLALGWLVRRGEPARRVARWGALIFAASLFAVIVLPGARGLLQASLALGLLDPLPLLHRSMHLVLLPLLDRGVALLWPFPRQHLLAPVTAVVLALVLLSSLWRPRAFCRMLCPLGALLGLLGKLAPWRIAKARADCSACGRCDEVCAGAAEPAGTFHQERCVLCLNCTEVCPEGLLALGARRSAAGEAPAPDLARRDAALALAAGLCAVPCLRLEGSLRGGGSARLVRPPGALAEAAFLARCVACGQCMRICPSNVLQPAGLLGGIETAWTPVLDMRIGTSGCLPSCTACGRVCPTGAIRPLSEDEKLGTGEQAARGPVRIGTAFVDRSRCLPWAMGQPCVVCQELCPTSPKAVELVAVEEDRPGRGRIALQRPVVDPLRCTGCGICQHGCPVAGEGAIRVEAAGESRHPEATLVLGTRRGAEARP